MTHDIHLQLLSSSPHGVIYPYLNLPEQEFTANDVLHSNQSYKVDVFSLEIRNVSFEYASDVKMTLILFTT